MKIFFDHQTFSIQSYGGISRYYSELLSGINQTPSNEAHLLALFSNNEYLNEKKILLPSFFSKTDFPKKQQFLYRINEAYSTVKMCMSQYDIFHATYYNSYFIPYLKNRPFVVTFLDMIHEKFSNQFYELAADKVITSQKAIMANKADAIITISESTKQDVVELFNIDPVKIKVIYLGNSLKINNNILVENEFIKIEPYLLFVGRRGHYKNFQGLVQAIYPLLKQYSLNLLCGGGDPFSKEEVLLLQKLGVEKLVKYIPVDDYTLQTLYQNAIAFVFPTLYEGFGIPILEAFACSCPCIVSNTSSLPEVAGNAALYIDPLSPDSIADAVEKLVNDQTLRQELIHRGQNRLLQFSWKKTVDETLALYRSIS